ncbi:hypothetical protein Daus18300_003022 [Diaporthe australafricana]|uniref:Piwi domain-containing protein n=1 Tax=Diaporthe australafricana TaxID=127596 RepID=A0ABR3XJC6_9PEZI
MADPRRGGRGGRGRGGSGQILKGIAIRPAAEQNLAAIKEEGLPTRPCVAVNSRPVALYANCFDLKVNNDNLTVFKYTFKVLGDKNQEIKGATAKSIFQHALETKLNPQPQEYATDFKQHIFTLSPLKLLGNGNERLDLEGCAVEFESTVPFQLDASVMTSPSPDAIDCLDLITGQWAREQTNIAAIGRHKFFPDSKNVSVKPPPGSNKSLILGNHFDTGIPESLSVLRGFFQSVRPADARLLLNVNATFGVFRPAGMIEDLYNDLAKKQGERIEVLTKLHGAISKARVVYKFPKDPKSSKTTRIAGIARLSDKDNGKSDKAKDHPLKITRDFPGPSDVQFWFKDGQTEGYRSVTHHYLKKWGMTVKTNLPLINIGKPSRPEYIPAEFCRLEWGQQLRCKVTEIPDLSNAKLEELNKFTCRGPNDNKAWIESVHQPRYLKLDPTVNRVLKNFGVSFGKELVNVTGRLLDPPTISYSKNGRAVPQEASWFLRKGQSFVRKAAKKVWMCVYFGGRTKNIPEDVKNGVGELCKHLQDCGQVSEFEGVMNRCVTESEGIAGLNEILRSAKSKGIAFIILVLPRRMPATVYNAVKFFGDIHHGIHTSCVVAAKFWKAKQHVPDWNYFTNVALKINLKLGGINHSLEDPADLFKKDGLMVAGYDVTHPTEDPKSGNETKDSGSAKDGVKGPEEATGQPQRKESPLKGLEKEQSQVGLVVSADKDLGQWLPYYWNQTSGQEMTNATLTEAFESRLKVLRSRNGEHSSLNVVIYRDGVSESQFDQVLQQEIPQIRQAYAKVYPDTPVRITLVVAIKRHTTRFFPKGANDGDSKHNIKPGTVVDNVVTQPKYWEFFLAAHSAIQGTARPTRYVVILDEIFRKDYQYQPQNPTAQLETFTHEMSYLFGRATKAVGVCTPAYYADILCTRARAYMSALGNRETRPLIEASIANLPKERQEAILKGEIHPDLKDSMYWI